MSGHHIETIQDLIRILRDQPEWKEELRRLILTEELLALPAAFERFREDEFRPLAQRVDRIEGDVQVLKQDVAELKQDVAILKQDVAVLKQDVAVLKQDVKLLKQDVARLKTDVGDLKGDNFERKVRENAAAYLGRLISRARLVPHEQLADILEDAFDEGRINETERDDAILIDLAVRGRLRHDKNRDVLLATEVSVVVDRHDAERAARRAAILGRAHGIETIGVVVGQDRTEGALEAAEALDVVLIV